MFTKIEEIVYREDKQANTKDIGKKYSYTDDLQLLDIVDMVKDSDYNIKYIDVSIDDDYAYGAGPHSIEDFYAMYDDLISIESVSFNINELNSRLVVFPGTREAVLNFRNVRETPATEITDILKEKKMKL